MKEFWVTKDIDGHVWAYDNKPVKDADGRWESKTKGKRTALPSFFADMNIRIGELKKFVMEEEEKPGMGNPAKQKDIENRAACYSGKAVPAYTNGCFDKYNIQQAFVDGAAWALGNQWIDVNKELPEELEDILVMSGHCGHGVDIGFYDGRFKAFFRTLSGDERILATHWMPIPKFTKKEE